MNTQFWFDGVEINYADAQCFSWFHFDQTKTDLDNCVPFFWSKRKIPLIWENMQKISWTEDFKISKKSTISRMKSFILNEIISKSISSGKWIYKYIRRSKWTSNGLLKEIALTRWNPIQNEWVCERLLLIYWSFMCRCFLSSDIFTSRLFSLHFMLVLHRIRAVILDFCQVC